jgi:hypothetical protein
MHYLADFVIGQKFGSPRLAVDKSGSRALRLNSLCGPSISKRRLGGHVLRRMGRACLSALMRYSRDPL